MRIFYAVTYGSGPLPPTRLLSFHLNKKTPARVGRRQLVRWGRIHSGRSNNYIYYPFDGPAIRCLRTGSFASRRYRRFAVSWINRTFVVRMAIMPFIP